MRDAIKSSFLIRMADDLDLLELGAAVRIMARILEKKAPLPNKNLHLVAGVDKAAWEAMAPSVLAHFACGDKGVSMGDASHPIESVAGPAKAVRKGTTPPLFPPVPKGAAKPESLPAYLAARSKPVSIRSAIYDTGLRVLMHHGVAEKIARSTIAGWLKAYSESAVAEAIAAAQERTDLDDPHSWIVARLRASARGVRIHPGVGSAGATIPRAKAGDINGMSDTTFAAVMERNRKLRETRLGSTPQPPQPSEDTQ